ncbi:MFS transporter [Lactobacillus sp. DCY120]|uniref:MFS transporter n=1 Tax=Bombilactobacillus apium TaxID=2675299 RepID=A0A850R6B5_9LACO|nr:MFS transporter [Bombilactobacillus apium]NVY96377.1 MFS transporter [Bombilactobacillus apium]
MTTIPSLFLIVGLIGSNWLADKWGLKPIILAGVSLTALAELLPLVVNNFVVLMITRALFGLGVGFFNSLLVVLISYFFTGQERLQMLGLQSSFEVLGGVLSTFIAGQLVQFNWHLSFLAYAITLPTLILFACFVPAVPLTISQRRLKANRINPLVLVVVGVFVVNLCRD